MLVKPFTPKRPRVEMVPLIDMFFLLLVFFIFGVFSMTMQQGIIVDLPSAQTVASQQEETVTISLTADGALFFNQEPVTKEALAALLRDTQRTQPTRLVVLNADRTAQHGRVIEVLDLVRQSGLQRVSFQASPEPT